MWYNAVVGHLLWWQGALGALSRGSKGCLGLLTLKAIGEQEDRTCRAVENEAMYAVGCHETPIVAGPFSVAGSG